MSTLFETISHVDRSAEISECGKYRWWLRRSWQCWDEPAGMHVRGKGVCCFVMLNPSTADGLQDDPTIRRCIGFARAWGYDSLSVRNLFPYRATKPKYLLKADKPDGGLRGMMEILAACTADLMIAAWGASVPFGRDQKVLAAIRKEFPRVAIYCLGATKAGHPRHQLYVKADTLPTLLAPGAHP